LKNVILPNPLKIPTVSTATNNELLSHSSDNSCSDSEKLRIRTISNTLFNEAEFAKNLGLNVRKNKFGYTISQENYIENILKKFNIKENQKASTPCTGDDVKLINKIPFDKTIYQSAVGCLIYVSKSTKPDISFSVSKASRKNSNPTVSDWSKVVNILKYLNQAKNYYISYKNKRELIDYTDSDFVRDLSNSKST